MPDAIDARTDLVQMPPGTPTGFPVAQVFSEEGSELDTPLAEGLMANLNAALVQQFLHVSVTQGKAVVQPDRVLDDCHRETVAVGLGVGHGQSAYPDPVKANAGKLRPTNENSSCRCARLDHQRKLEAKGVEMLERLVAGCGQQCGAEIHPSL